MLNGSYVQDAPSMSWMWICSCTKASYFNTLVTVIHKKTPHPEPPSQWKQWVSENTVSNWSLSSGLLALHLFSLGIRVAHCPSTHNPWKRHNLPPSGPDLTWLTLVSAPCTPPCDPFAQPWGWGAFFFWESEQKDRELGLTVSICMCVWRHGGGGGVTSPISDVKQNHCQGGREKAVINATGCLFERWKRRRGGV